MEEEKYQKELFEFEKPKRFFPRLSDFFPKADFERNVILTLTLDRAVFIAIGLIMIMVVTYALGVEAGKSRAIEAAQANTIAPNTAVPVVVQTAAVAVPQGKTQIQPGTVIRPQPVARTPVPSIKAQPLAKIQPPARVQQPAPIKAAAKPYTIVVATLTRKDTALREAGKLKLQGFDAAVVPNDRYFQVWVGSYADKTGSQSQKDLKKIKKLYKDAYLKLK